MALTRRTFLGLAVPSALALAGCGDSRLPPPCRFGAGATTPRRGGTLRFSISDEVTSLDPAIAYDAPTHDAAVGLLYDTLLDYPPSTAPNPTELIPQLADRWSCSADGTVYTFHIREGARFWNGEPVLAEDFVYALDRLLDPAVRSPVAWLFDGISGAADRLAAKTQHIVGVRAVDAATLEIRLDLPDASFPYLMALRFTTPLKKSHVEAVGPRIRELPLGTGPFVLREWKEGQRIVHERNPIYWNGERPWLERIVTDLVVPNSAAALKFLRGEYDTLYYPAPDDYLRFASSSAWRPYLDHTVELATEAFMMNTRKAPFSDKRVRQAMNYAIHKEALVRLSNGRLVAANGYLPPGMPGYNPHRKPYPHNPEKARRLLVEAGYPDGFDMVFSNTRGARASADLWGESIQADLEAVGIRLKLQYLSVAALENGIAAGEIAFAMRGWWMDFPDPWNFLEEKFHSRMSRAGGTNDSFYSNPEFDRLVDQARRELDREKRLALYQRAEDILYDDCPNVWIGFPRRGEVRQPYVQGYKYHPCRWRNYRDTWLDEPIKEAP